MMGCVSGVGEGRETADKDSMTVKLIGKLLEMSWFFRLSNTHQPPLPAFSAFSLSDIEQMRPLLAGPKRHQRVREGASEEHGRAASTRLHPQEAGGDPSGPGRKSRVLS